MCLSTWPEPFFLNGQYLQAVFQPTFTGQYLGFKVTPSKVNDYADFFFGYSLDFLGNTDGLSSSDVESVVKNSGLATATDIKSVQSAQEEIKEEITGMQEKQEETNQKLDDVKDQVKEGFEECRDSYNLLPQPYKQLTSSKSGNGLTITLHDDYSFTVKGTATADGYINITSSLTNFFNSTIMANSTNRCSNGYCLAKDLTYDNNNHTLWVAFSKGQVFDKTYYPMITLEKNFSSSYEPYGEQVCKNRIDDLKDQENKNHKETMDTITSEEMPDSSEYGNVAGWLPAGTIDSLINLPLSLLTSINNSATKTCSPYQLPFINNTTISLPCIGNYLENLDGFGSIVETIDLFMSVFLLYKLLMSLYKDIQKHLDLKNTDSDLGGIE